MMMIIFDYVIFCFAVLLKQLYVCVCVCVLQMQSDAHVSELFDRQQWGDDVLAKPVIY